jgi:hypothetical protein
VALQLVNGLFAIFLQAVAVRMNLRENEASRPIGQPASLPDLDSPPGSPFKARKSLKPQEFSGGRKAEAIRWNGE